MPIISITDAIDDYTVFEVDTILKNNDLSKDYDIIVSSPGGSITAGLQIVAKLDMIEGNKTVHIQGLAASMATVIASAGDRVVMSANGFFMIHNPWTIVMGESEELRKEADLMDKMRDELISIYQRKTKLSRKAIIELLNEETWLTPAEALELGFIDEIKTSEMAIAASIVRDPSKLASYKNLPKELQQKLKGVSNMADFEEQEELLDEVGEVETSEEVEEVLEEEEVEVDEVELADIENSIEEDADLVEDSEASKEDAAEDESGEEFETAEDAQVEEVQEGLVAKLIKAFKGDKFEAEAVAVDYKAMLESKQAEFNALLEENEQLAELANGQQSVIDELEGQMQDLERACEEKYNETELIIDAVLNSKITAHQLKQFKNGEISDEELVSCIAFNEQVGLGIQPQVEKAEVLKPEESFPQTKFKNAKELGEWLNTFEGVERTKAFRKYKQKFNI